MTENPKILGEARRVGEEGTLAWPEPPEQGFDLLDDREIASNRRVTGGGDGDDRRHLHVKPVVHSGRWWPEHVNGLLGQDRIVGGVDEHYEVDR